jgi:hypothetical protein
MFNSNSNNSIAKTPSQAEFEQFFQAHAQAQAQAMMAQGNKTPSGGGGGMTQSGSGQDFTNLSPTEMMMNTNNTNVGVRGTTAERDPESRVVGYVEDDVFPIRYGEWRNHGRSRDDAREHARVDAKSIRGE